MTKEEIVVCLDKRIHEIKKEIDTTWSIWRGNESDWSRQIACKQSEACSMIKDVFGIDLPNWNILFDAATKGSGNEIDKILTLHSSSLLALLCFAHVSDKNPLKIGNHTYIKCWFEVQNRVFENPSSIDVVLKATDGSLLFIESKFTEYLKKSYPSISDNYFDFYKSILRMLPGTPLQMVYPKVRQEKEKTFYDLGLCTTSRGKEYEDLYMAGIKQCFSHLIGLANGSQNDNEECWADIDGKPILFASILYKFRDKHFTLYTKFYADTIGKVKADMLSKSLPNTAKHINQIEVLPNVLTYQEVFSDPNFKLPVNVRKFYNL